MDFYMVFDGSVNLLVRYTGICWDSPGPGFSRGPSNMKLPLRMRWIGFARSAAVMSYYALAVTGRWVKPVPVRRFEADERGATCDFQAK